MTLVCLGLSSLSVGSWAGDLRSQRKLVFFSDEKKKKATGMIHIVIAYFELLPWDKSSFLPYLSSLILTSKFLPSHMNSPYQLGILLINSYPWTSSQEDALGPGS